MTPFSAGKPQRHNQPKAAEFEYVPEQEGEGEEFEPITKKTRQQIEILAAELSDIRGEDYDRHMASLEGEIGEKLASTTEAEAQKWLGRYKKALSKVKTGGSQE